VLEALGITAHDALVVQLLHAMAVETMHVLVSHCAVPAEEVRAVLAEGRRAFATLAARAGRR
jgi:hypothetical protein